MSEKNTFYLISASLLEDVINYLSLPSCTAEGIHEEAEREGLLAKIREEFDLRPAKITVVSINTSLVEEAPTIHQKKCGVCGKNMSYGYRSISAMKISILGEEDHILREQFGRFYKQKDYYLCYECWLTSLGFRP